MQKQLNVAKEKEKQQNQLGQASMAGLDPGPGQTENASSSQPKPEPKGDVDDDMKSEDGVKEMEGVVTFKTEPNQKEHTFIWNFINYMDLCCFVFGLFLCFFVALFP